MTRRSQPSADSSPASFYTSKEEGSERNTKSTTASTTPPKTQPCPYRAARELPHELKEHCQIFLEEQLCMHAHM
jgi:hypothetical protein